MNLQDINITNFKKDFGITYIMNWISDFCDENIILISNESL